MKVPFKMGLRARVILVFLVLYGASMIYLHQFFRAKQGKIKMVLDELRIDTELAEIVKHLPPEHRDDGEDLLSRIGPGLAALKATQVFMGYSVGILLLMMLVSIFIFVVLLNKITRPLKELQEATAKVREGDFSVHLPEKGIDEIRLVKQSFNAMSRELENTQKRLLLAEKEMIWKDLSRVLAHEIKNPLTPIQLAIQRLEDKYENDPDRFREIFPEAAGIIHQEIGNLRQLVQSFSNFARISQPNQMIFDPCQSIQEIVKPYIHDYDIRMDLLEDHRIRFDKTHFYQIVTNILQNAIDVTPDSGTITIELKRSHGYLILLIADQGPGISPEDMARIFEPYFTKKKRGTGLGLALVKRLAEANHAVIRVKSHNGATFELIMEDIFERTDRG